MRARACADRPWPSALPRAARSCCACSVRTAGPRPARRRTSVGRRAPLPGYPAPRHDGALLRAPGHHLYHVLGPHRHRRALVRAEGTQPRVRDTRAAGLPADTAPGGGGGGGGARCTSAGPRPTPRGSAPGRVPPGSRRPVGGRGPGEGRRSRLQKGGEPAVAGEGAGSPPSAVKAVASP